jgi:hypothetical protein
MFRKKYCISIWTSMRMTRRHALALFVAAGCSRESGPPAAPPYDGQGAREALVASLEAWKTGQAKALARRTPPIRFEDDDLTAGLRLAEYEIEEPDAPIRLHEDVGVILSLRDARGQAVRREARYQVATVPGLAVIRTDR